MNPDGVESDDERGEKAVVYVVVPASKVRIRTEAYGGGMSALNQAQALAGRLAQDEREDYCVFQVREHRPGEVGLRAVYHGVTLKVQDTEGLPLAYGDEEED